MYGYGGFGGFPRTVSYGSPAGYSSFGAAPAYSYPGGAVTTPRVVSSSANLSSTVSSLPRTTYSGASYPGVVQPGFATSYPSPYGYGGAVRYGGYGAPTVTYAQPGLAQPGFVRAGSTTPYTLGKYSQRAYESKHAGDAQLASLKEVRQNCGLLGIPVKDGLAAFKAAAMDGKLDKGAFEAAYGQLLSNFGIAVPDQKVIDAVFDLFDRDDNGILDMMELVCGISLLCQGNEDDKLQAVFWAFDENGDGFVSMDEMVTFLTSVFNVVLTPAVQGILRAQGVDVETPEALAEVTAKECFEEGDLNHDGKLSIDEFRKWFYAPQTDPSLVFSPIRNVFQ